MPGAKPGMGLLRRASHLRRPRLLNLLEVSASGQDVHHVEQWNAVLTATENGRIYIGASPASAALHFLTVGQWELAAACAPKNGGGVCLADNVAWASSFYQKPAADYPDDRLRETLENSETCARSAAAGQCSPACRKVLEGLRPDGCCAKHRAAQLLYYAASSPVWADMTGFDPGFRQDRVPQRADSAAAALAGLCDMPELMQCSPPPCDAKVELAVPLLDVQAAAAGLEEALRSDLAAGAGEEPSALSFSRLQIVTKGKAKFASAVVHVGVAPCERAQAIAAAIQSQVDEGGLAFPSLAAVAPPQPPAPVQRKPEEVTVQGELVLSERPDEEAKTKIAQGIARAVDVSTDDVRVEVKGGASLLQARDEGDEVIVEFEVTKPVKLGKAVEMQDSLREALADASDEGPFAGLPLVPGKSVIHPPGVANPGKEAPPAAAPVAEPVPKGAAVQEDLSDAAVHSGAAVLALLALGALA